MCTTTITHHSARTCVLYRLDVRCFLVVQCGWSDSYLLRCCCYGHIPMHMSWSVLKFWQYRKVKNKTHFFLLSIPSASRGLLRVQVSELRSFFPCQSNLQHDSKYNMFLKWTNSGANIYVAVLEVLMWLLSFLFMCDFFVLLLVYSIPRRKTNMRRRSRSWLINWKRWADFLVLENMINIRINGIETFIITTYTL